MPCIYECDPEDAWMIGNSARSDILPAQNLGLYTIWVTTERWAYDHQDDNRIDPTFTAKNLAMVAEFLLRGEIEYQAVA